ncbi:DUF421 domain-containing protein [Chryseosolibacter indicus]|uniref:DUF421 domain-containing protein n=1 Tax=Chryseosolibacter indicus TaxID=2782351 RepID=A0ABS5VQ15_9BACT|nr:YetF domain-containing protein [Chryseosolibacter indicus]MBT1702874.1 DUF421 domain-containing protein [Chryseosolibacter indicus]
MESVIIRSAIVYMFLFVVLRMAGKRTLSEMTTFDLILVLIISEATQQALIDDDHSIMGGMLVILTLVFIDFILAMFSSKFRIFDKIINGVPMFLLENGTLHLDRMKKARVQLEDILEAARKTHGLESIDEIKSAVLEKDGSISVVPKYKDKLLGV